MKLDIKSIKDEAVAGHLWMRLNVPKDASRDELERHARDLIDGIGSDDSQAAVERQIRILQVQKLCRPLNLAAVSELASKSIAVARSVRR
jgi:hypothetical protein